jgi:hypothetical protein
MTEFYKNISTAEIMRMIDAKLKMFVSNDETIKKHNEVYAPETSHVRCRYASYHCISSDSIKMYRYYATRGDETLYSFYVVRTVFKPWEVTKLNPSAESNILAQVLADTSKCVARKSEGSMHETPKSTNMEVLIKDVWLLQSQIKDLQKDMEDVKAQSKPKAKECGPVEEREDNPRKSKEPFEDHPLYCRWVKSRASKRPETFKKVEIRVNHDALLEEALAKARLSDTKGSSLRAIEKHEYFSSMYVDLEAGALVKLVLSRNLELPLVLAKSKLVETLVQHDLKVLS